MPERNPVVSVLVTAYNREAFVSEAIESVLHSSYSDFELVVVDDASSDRTSEIASRFAARDSRVSVHVNESNLGDYGNRNRAAEYATGEYLKYLDSDDVIYPHSLGVMVASIDGYPDAGLALSVAPDKLGPYPRRLTPREAYREHFNGTDIFGRAPGSAIIRRSAFEAVGGFSGVRQVGDHELWLRIARRYPVVMMPSDLVWDREHAGQQKRVDSDVERAVMHTRVAREALMADDCPLDAAERSAALAQLERNGARYVSQLVQMGELGAARDFQRGAGIPPRSIAEVFGGAVAGLLGGRRQT